MSLISKQLCISGMTCINCQNKIEQKLRNTAGITKAAVSYHKGIANITYDTELISLNDIIHAIEDLDYEVFTEQRANQPEITRTISLLVIIISLYLMLQQLGILNLLVPSQLADTNMGYGMLFLIGVITSVHCVAMCGGINLTQCIPTSEDCTQNNGKLSTFRPAVLYNLGRVISYTVIGFLLGLAGMFISGGTKTGLPTLIQGILKLIAGIFMVIMGLNMLRIFPWLPKFNLRMPKFLALKIGKQRRKSRQPLLIGLLNGLMPCGPLQSMQIVSLACANPFAGALSMFLFSLGTVPLMLGLGSIVSALGKKFTQKVMSVGAVLVVVLGLAMLSQGGSLSGLLLPNRVFELVIALGILGVMASIPFKQTRYKVVSLILAVTVMMVGQTAWNYMAEANGQKEATSDTEELNLVDGMQVVTSTLSPGSYPNITVQSGIPVKWIIDAPKGSINGCNYKMFLREYGIEYAFQEGENIIEFTPMETGVYGYTCWMGMIHGNIIVTDGNDATTGSDEKAYTILEPTNTNRTVGSCCVP